MPTLTVGQPSNYLNGGKQTCPTDIETKRRTRMTKRECATNTGLLLLRVSISCLMLVHGWQKISAYSDLADKFPDPLGMGNQLSLIAVIGAEFGCSLLLIVGLATRIAVLPLIFAMIIAHFVVHGSDPWKVKELAAVYLAVYSSILLTGPGAFSIDHLICKKKCNKQAAKDSGESS